MEPAQRSPAGRIMLARLAATLLSNPTCDRRVRAGANVAGVLQEACAAGRCPCHYAARCGTPGAAPGPWGRGIRDLPALHICSSPWGLGARSDLHSSCPRACAP